MAVGAAAIAAFALLGTMALVAAGLGMRQGTAIQWWGTPDGKAPRFVLPLTALFLALGAAALALTAAAEDDSANMVAYQALVAAYYGLMLVYVGLMATAGSRKDATSTYAAVGAVLVVAGAVQLTATGFLAAVAFGGSDDLVSVAFVLQLAASLWAALYDAIYYPVPSEAGRQWYSEVKT
jgi:hypothetical protein